jgi:hypothetical protein
MVNLVNLVNNCDQTLPNYSKIMKKMTIPVTFTYQGKDYSGELSDVHGGGTHHYHLMVQGFYWGRLRFANGEWVFDENPVSMGLEKMADYFGSVVVSYHQ